MKMKIKVCDNNVDLFENIQANESMWCRAIYAKCGPLPAHDDNPPNKQTDA